MNSEIWKPIKGYEGYYEVSKTGLVRSLGRRIQTSKGVKKINGKQLSTHVNNCGYLVVKLSKDGTDKTHSVHALIAEAFIPKAENKTEVNHINGNKLDNSINNLEWVTHSENMKHAFSTGLCKKPGKEVYHLFSGIIFSSVKQASAFLNIPYSTLKNELSGHRKMKNFLFYSDEEELRRIYSANPLPFGVVYVFGSHHKHQLP